MIISFKTRHTNDHMKVTTNRITCELPIATFCSLSSSKIQVLRKVLGLKECFYGLSLGLATFLT